MKWFGIGAAWCGIGAAVGCAAGAPPGPAAGHATVELLAARSGYEPGQPLVVGIRMVLDEGWHTYWVNPGTGGMKPAVEWRLPAGWSAGELQFPAPPQRFGGGDAVSFGYAGQVVFPVILTPAASDKEDAKPVTVGARVTWLACDADACVPGEADVTLALAPGAGEEDEAAAQAITAALAAVPVAFGGIELDVNVTATGGRTLVLSLKLPEILPWDLATAGVFAVTEAAIDDPAVVQFARDGGAWRATAPLHRHAPGPPPALELVLAGGNLPHPVLVRTKSAP